VKGRFSTPGGLQSSRLVAILRKLQTDVRQRGDGRKQQGSTHRSKEWYSSKRQVEDSLSKRSKEIEYDFALANERKL
jgi:hypothetical protein